MKLNKSLKILLMLIVLAVIFIVWRFYGVLGEKVKFTQTSSVPETVQVTPQQDVTSSDADNTTDAAVTAAHGNSSDNDSSQTQTADHMRMQSILTDLVTEKLEKSVEPNIWEKIISKFGIHVKKSESDTVNKNVVNDASTAKEAEAVQSVDVAPVVDVSEEAKPEILPQADTEEAEAKDQPKAEATPKPVPAATNVAITPSQDTSNNGKDIKQLLHSLQQSQKADAEHAKPQAANDADMTEATKQPVSAVSVPSGSNVVTPDNKGNFIKLTPKQVDTPQTVPLIIIGNKKTAAQQANQQMPQRHAVKKQTKSKATTYYVLQIMSGENKRDMLDFIKKHKLGASARYIKLANRYILVYGNYSSVAEAHAAMQTLPEAIKEKQPWIKPMHAGAAIK